VTRRQGGGNDSPQALRVADSSFEQMTQQLGGGAFLRAQINLRGTTRQTGTTNQVSCAASTPAEARAAEEEEVDWLRNCPRLRRLARRCLPERSTGPTTDDQAADALELVWEAMGPAPRPGSCLRSAVVFKPAVGASNSISTDLRTNRLDRRNSAHIVVPKGKGDRKKSVAQTMNALQKLSLNPTGDGIMVTRPVRPRQKSSPAQLPSDGTGPRVARAVASPTDTLCGRPQSVRQIERELALRTMTRDTWSQFCAVIEKEVDRHRRRNRRSTSLAAAVDFAGCYAAITITITKPEVEVNAQAKHAASAPDTPTCHRALAHGSAPTVGAGGAGAPGAGDLGESRIVR
jgi:hypothetical protein